MEPVHEVLLVTVFSTRSYQIWRRRDLGWWRVFRNWLAKSFCMEWRCWPFIKRTKVEQADGCRYLENILNWLNSPAFQLISTETTKVLKGHLLSPISLLVSCDLADTTTGETAIGRRTRAREGTVSKSGRCTLGFSRHVWRNRILCSVENTCWRRKCFLSSLLERKEKLSQHLIEAKTSFNQSSFEKAS